MEPVAGMVTAALATLRLAKEAAKKFKDAGLSEKLQNVYDLVADMRHHLFALEDENRRLKAEIEELKCKKEIDNQLAREGEVYYRTSDGKKTGPFCPLCWDADRRLVGTQLLGNGRHICNIHKVSFANPGHETSDISIVSGGPSIWDKQF